MAVDPTVDLQAQLHALEREERSVSLQRRSLQDRLDLFAGDPAAAEHLRRRERELSTRRRELHERIDELRRAGDAS